MIYLDNGATSFPKPPSVIRESVNCMENYAVNAGRGAHRLSLKAAEKIWETRSLIAKLFHIQSPERIVFTQNCTEAINTGMKGLLENGDDIIISDMEHNSVYRPAVSLQKKGVRTLFARSESDGTVSPDEILRQITPRTRLICIQHASNVGGGVNPIGEIGKMARERGIPFMVDAAQTAGKTSIDVDRDNIDLLAFPGHKGLMGPPGTGGLYIREGLDIPPMREGGTGGNSESPFMPDFLPDRLEGGTVNLTGIAGLCGGVRFVLRHGEDAIGRYERNLVNRFMEGMKGVTGVRILGPRDINRRIGLVALSFDDLESTEIARILDKKYGICVRAGLHCSPLAAKRFDVLKGGSLRVSPGVFNTVGEIDYVIRALKNILKKQNI